MLLTLIKEIYEFAFILCTLSLFVKFLCLNSNIFVLPFCLFLIS